MNYVEQNLTNEIVALLIKEDLHARYEWLFSLRICVIFRQVFMFVFPVSFA